MSDPIAPAAVNQASLSADVLVVGGGPAGAASAVYAARKGIRTGIAAERLPAGHRRFAQLRLILDIPDAGAYRRGGAA